MTFTDDQQRAIDYPAILLSADEVLPNIEDVRARMAEQGLHLTVDEHRVIAGHPGPRGHSNEPTVVRSL